MKYDIEVPVLIVGGGPVGLTLAMELQHQGIEALLCERNPATTSHPKMDITNGRSMELFRRLGYSQEIRSHAIPEENPFSVIWATSLAGGELARFDYPTVKQCWQKIKDDSTGTLSSEPYMRVSQVIVEPVLKGILERDASLVKVRFGFKLEHFEQDDDGVTALLTEVKTGKEIVVRSKFLVGCDGGGSRVRRGLGIGLDKISVLELLNNADGVGANLKHAFKNLFRGKLPLDGRVYIVHFKSRDKKLLDKFGVAWHLQTPQGATLIGQDDVDTYTLHMPLEMNQNPEKIDPKAFLFKALGMEFDAEVLVSNHWQPQLGLADSYGKGRVWLAGDSAHQYIPTGGYGMNTGVGDAVGLGWTLASILNGWGGEALLTAYQDERRTTGARNRQASKRHMGVRIKISQQDNNLMHRNSAGGEQAREKIGQNITQLGNLENEAWGIELGYRYATSPAICHEEGSEPPSSWENYVPSTWPGARPPSVWVNDDTALFDLFDSKGFTLIRFNEVDVSKLEKAAAMVGLPLKVVNVKDKRVHLLYERDLVLIRPDQHVAWRGNSLPEDVESIVNKVRGVAIPA